MENRALGGHIISFSAGNTPFSRKRPRPDLSGEALRRTVSGRRPLRRPSRRPVRLPHRTVRFLHDPAPPGSFIVPPHPHAGTTATPLSRCPHHPLLFSRRSGNHSFRSAEPPRRLEQKNRLFFWSIRKIFTTFATYCSDNLVSAPQRFARRICLSSHPGIPMTGDVPAAGSEQHTETTYLSIFNQKHKSMKNSPSFS